MPVNTTTKRQRLTMGAEDHLVIEGRERCCRGRPERRLALVNNLSTRQQRLWDART
jgi:hypothetical protein